MAQKFLHEEQPEDPRQPTRLDEILAEGAAKEATPFDAVLDPLEEHQMRLATYLTKMTNQAVSIMLALENKESVKHEAAEDRQTLTKIQAYLEKPTKDKIITDEKVNELQKELNRIGQKYGIIDDYSLN